MPRKPRFFLPNVPVYIVQRGASRELKGVRSIKQRSVFFEACIKTFMTHKKPHLPEKICPVCQRSFTWRKK